MEPEQQTSLRNEHVDSHLDEASLAAAINGLMAAKLELIKCRDRLTENGEWIRFDSIWDQYTEDLNSIGARIDELIKYTGKQ